jgi:hypothetical protein
MKIHTTNYQNTFIEVAEDCPASSGEIPPIKGDLLSVANLQFELISKNPYRYTSDEVIFRVYAERAQLTESERNAARELFFSKGQPCLRSSPLTKRYGWGIHNDQDGKIALYGCESVRYQELSNSKTIKTVKAMRSKRIDK